MQNDGDLVLWKGGVSIGTALWSTSTWSSDAQYVTMQSDGNLVLYGSAGNAPWN